MNRKSLNPEISLKAERLIRLTEVIAEPTFLRPGRISYLEEKTEKTGATTPTLEYDSIHLKALLTKSSIQTNLESWSKVKTHANLPDSPALFNPAFKAYAIPKFLSKGI